MEIRGRSYRDSAGQKTTAKRGAIEITGVVGMTYWRYYNQENLVQKLGTLVMIGRPENRPGC